MSQYNHLLCQPARPPSEGPEPHNDCKNVTSEVWVIGLAPAGHYPFSSS